MRTTLFIALVSGLALADIPLKQANSTVGIVTSLNCAPDAGLLCSRDAGSVGNLRCNAASAVEPGCVTPSDQTLGNGKKTFLDRTNIACKPHSSLTACSAGEKGTWQSCCDHNAPVYCDGTTNRELLGTSTDEKVLGVINVNGIPVQLMGGNFTLQTAGTVTAIEGSWGAGTTSDAGTVVMRLTDGSNNCDCTVPCAAPATRTACSGNCTFAAGVTISPSRNATTCTTQPYVGGELLVKGTQ